MGSSPRFASTAPDKCRPVKTRFPYGSPAERVNLGPGPVTRRIIMQQARGQAVLRHRPPTACRHGVSGSVSSPLIGVLPTVQRTTLLGSFLLPVVIECLALQDGPAVQAGFTCPTLLGYRIELPLSPTGLSPALVPFSKGLRLTVAHLMAPAPRPRVVSHPVGFVPRSLAATEESRLISFPPGTEMFQFPGS